MVAERAGGRLLVLLLAGLAGVVCPTSPLDAGAAVVIQPSSGRLPPPAGNATPADALLAQGSGAVALKLCECERATGAPNGLSCDKEGWFISSFERQGQWVAGGGYVPLSHAICCRPCLPDELPPDPSGHIPGGQAPLAVISLGCHPTTDRVLPTRCEEGAGSFVVGYSEAIKVFSRPDTYYPVNTVQCCTPALLLGNGDAWELERCECRDSTDRDFPVSCGGADTNELLLGYNFFRLSPLGHVVPVGPAQCCKACLSGTVHPMNQCDDLNACSGHGVCNMRRCECFDGWTGADCSQTQRNGKGIPPWAIALIVLSSSALAGIFIIAAVYALQALGAAPGSAADSEDGDGEERQPLLIRIDPDDSGSVGSEDTTDGEDEVDAEEVERRVNRTIQRLERVSRRGAGEAGGAASSTAGAAEPQAESQVLDAQGAEARRERESEAQAAAEAAGQGGGAGMGDEEPPATPDGAGRPEQLEAGLPAASQEGAATDTESAVPPAAGADAAAPAAAAVGAAAGAAAEEEAEDLVKPPNRAGTCGPTPEGPLAMVDCVVCMSRPVQVVVVPCGHCCCCRRCSRRLTRCPICRKEIARRQRLYV